MSQKDALEDLLDKYQFRKTVFRAVWFISFVLDVLLVLAMHCDFVASGVAVKGSAVLGVVFVFFSALLVLCIHLEEVVIATIASRKKEKS